MVIFILEPFLNHSHSYWLNGMAEHLEAEVKTFTLPAKHWKWRMNASAISFVEKIKHETEPDHIVVSDMCSASLLKALLPRNWDTYKLSVYFHENQITYPWHQRDQEVKKDRDNHYGFINYSSALAADKVFFNSHYHKNAFLTALPSFLEKFPDYKNTSSIPSIAPKCHVSPLGINTSSHISAVKWKKAVPIILWNHKWEHDKNPKDFFHALIDLHNKGLAFKLIVLGRHGKVYPDIFEEAKELLANHIIHWGYVATKTEYDTLIKQAHLLPVTSIQEFFGVNVLEAISAGAYPLLPERLAFPEHLSETIPYYNTAEELLEKLEEILTDWKLYAEILKSKTEEYVLEVSSKYQWEVICREFIENLNSN